MCAAGPASLWAVRQCGAGCAGEEAVPEVQPRGARLHRPGDSAADHQGKGDLAATAAPMTSSGHFGLVLR